MRKTWQRIVCAIKGHRVREWFLTHDLDPRCSRRYLGAERVCLRVGECERCHHLVCERTNGPEGSESERN